MVELLRARVFGQEAYMPWQRPEEIAIVGTLADAIEYYGYLTCNRILKQEF